MNKFIYIAFIVLSCIACEQNNESKHVINENHHNREGWDNGPLKGDISKITVKKFELSYHFEKEETGAILSYETYHFNTRGNVSSQISYDTDGKIISITKYLYHENGKLAEKKTHFNDGSTVRERIAYDKDFNRLQTQKLNRAEELESFIDHSYDSIGNISRQTIYNAEGIVTNIRDYSFDENGKMIKISDNLNESFMTYNAKGLLIEHKVYDKSGTFEYGWHYTRYNDVFLKVSRLYDSHGDVLMSYLYNYDSTYNPIEVKCYEGPMEIPREQITYEIEYRNHKCK